MTAAAAMILNDLWNHFQTDLFPRHSSSDLFNHYRDSDPRVDRKDAAARRKRNLREYLDTFARKPEFLLIGEAPGPWGCRFSGIPFTSELQLETGLLPINGRRSSRQTPRMATRIEPPYRSRSSEVFWGSLRRHHDRFLVWNCVPFHPHRPGQVLSIRPPKTSEIAAFSNSLRRMWEIVRPEVTVAVGRKAQHALERIDVPCTYVRHPARGGHAEFAEGIDSVVGELGA